MSTHRLARKDTLPAVGREVDAHCSKCKRVELHRVAAMIGNEVARVECKICHSEHKYKSGKEVEEKAKEKALAGPRRSTKAATPPPDPNRGAKQLFQRAMADRDRGVAISYNASLGAKLGLLVDHKTFGYGIVDAVFEGKSRILFENGYKMLVTGRTAG